jgi:hypothetical protein
MSAVAAIANVWAASRATSVKGEMGEMGTFSQDAQKGCSARPQPMKAPEA